MAGEASFIANINNVAAKIDIIESANDIFDEGVIPILEEIAALDLEEAIEDLAKGTFFGNRKIDMDLALNNKPMYDYVEAQAAIGLTPDANTLLEMWVDPVATVYYDSATILYVDGHVIDIVFMDPTDTNPESVASHSEVILHIEQDAAYDAYTTESSMFVDNAGIIGQLARAVDIVGSASNLERITLHVDQVQGGQPVSTNPVYFWGLTTSAFETLSMRTADIIKLGNEIDNIIELANSIDELLELQESLPELVDNIDSIYNNMAKLNIIYDEMLAITTVYDDIKVGGTNYVNTAATDLQLGATSTITTVSTDLQLGVDSNVKIVSDDIANINAVSTNLTPITVNADNIVPINTNADNIVDIQNASANATTATEQATISTDQATISTEQAVISTEQAVIATAQAVIATAQADDIKGVTVENTVTGSPGSDALVTFNSATSEFTFVIPEGDKGERGESFTVNAVGNDRSLYDDQPEGFSFLDLTTSLIYFKASNVSADWTAGSPFGQGATGATGDTGNGVLNTLPTSTTNPGGDYAVGGFTDTYTITYTDASTDTFDVYNGADSLDINDTVTASDSVYSSSFIDSRIGLSELISDGVISGLNFSSTGLDGEVSTGAAVITGQRVEAVVLDANTFTASSATYVDLTKFREFVYTEVVIDIAQQSTINVDTAADTYDYIATVNGTPYTYTSATPTKEVETITITTATPGNVYAIDIDATVTDYTAQAGDVPTDVAAALAALIGAQASDNLDGSFTVTAVVAGVPQSVYIDASTTDSGEINGVTTTANIDSDTLEEIATGLSAAIVAAGVADSAAGTLITLDSTTAGVAFTLTVGGNLTDAVVIPNVTEPAEPSVAADSMRLYKILTDGTDVTNISDRRTSVVYGNDSQVFKVADAVDSNDAVTKAQLDVVESLIAAKAVAMSIALG